MCICNVYIYIYTFEHALGGALVYLVYHTVCDVIANLLQGDIVRDILCCYWQTKQNL